MKFKSKIVIGLIILGNLVVFNFALAQTPPPPPAPTPAPAASDIKLTKTDFDKADLSLEACIGTSASDTNSLRYKVLQATEGKIKANFLTSTSLGGRRSTSCYLTSANAPEDRQGFLAIYRRPEIVNFEIRVKSTYATTTAQREEGIRPAVIVEQIKKNDESKKDSGASLVSTLIGWVLNALLKVVASFLGLLTALAAGVLNTTLGYMFEVTTMPTVVNVGWVIVRDICNMFFILAFIIMALATILQIENYNYKHILRNLIMMAILVNFSKVIAVTMMNFVNSIAYMFYNGGMFKDIVATIFKVSNPLNSLEEAAQGGWMGALTSGLGANAFMLLGTVLFLALAGMFVIRLVGLYVLIIFSPLAFAARILPATEKYADEWWRHFLKYLIWAPVSLFMIRLTILVVKNDDQFQWVGGGAPDSSFTYFILCGFLAASLLVAKQAGMVGSEMVLNAAKSVGYKAPMWLGKRGFGFAARQWRDWTGNKLLETHEGQQPPGKFKKGLWSVLNAPSFFRGWEERAQEREHESKGLASASGREIATDLLTRGKLQLPYRQFAQRKIESEKSKVYQEMKKEAMMRRAVEIENLTGHEGEVERIALIKSAAANGFLDDLMRMKQFALKYTGSDNVVYGPEALNRFLYGYLGNGEQSMRFMAEDMEELGKRTKHFEYLGHAKYDPDSGTFERGMKVAAEKEKVKRGDKVYDVDVLENTWQQEYATSEFSKLGGRDRVGAAPHNFTVIRANVDDDGNFIAKGQEMKDDDLVYGRDVSKGGPAFGVFETKMMAMMDADTMREIQHAQARLKKWLLTEELLKGTDGTIELDDIEHFKEVEAMYKINPELVKGLYTKILKVKGDDRQFIDGLRIRIKDTGETKYISEDGQEPSFKYNDDPPKVKSAREAADPGSRPTKSPSGADNFSLGPDGKLKREAV